ncbi:MAG: LytTR family DNA-binding domain-containing protein [Bacteroidota bacterium]
MQSFTNLRPFFILLTVVLSIIIFEAFQQHYYIVRFKLSDEEVSVVGLMLLHLRRWAIWLVCTLPMAAYIHKRSVMPVRLTPGIFIRYAVIISTSLLFSIIIITAVELVIGGWKFQMVDFIETLQFFFFQKGPIYMIANIGVVVLISLQNNIQVHQFTIGKLSALQAEQQKLYDDLKNRSYDDESKFIQIKIGSQAKVVPVESIQWVEAEDYCVRLHTEDNASYILRSSMKSMEKILPQDKFIRIHRKYIVNLGEVDRFFFSQTPEVRLIDSTRLSVAQSRVAEIKKHLAVEPGIPS